MTLLEQQQLFSSLIPGLINQAIILGFQVTLGEAFRTPEQAKWNEEHGKGISNSLHLSRLAIDLLLFKDGQYITNSNDYLPLGEWWENQNILCAWGGRFSSVDGNHFSLTRNGIR